MQPTLAYQQNLKKLHEKKSFGTRSTIPLEVIRCIEQYKIESILDFGSGKGHVVESLKLEYPNLTVYGYDPVRDSYDQLPTSVDMIFSTDVLEHVEPELLNKTICDLANRTTKVMYHLIACHPAKKMLADGRNAHLIIESPQWWKETLSSIEGWKMYNEEIIQYTAQLKKGPPIDIIKFGVTMEKNNGKS